MRSSSPERPERPEADSPSDSPSFTALRSSVAQLPSKLTRSTIWARSTSQAPPALRP